MSRKKGQVRPKNMREYAVCVVEPIDRRWAGILAETDITPVNMPDGTAATRIIARVPDQAALRGILCRLWDLGLTVIRLERLSAGNEERSV